MTRASTRGGNYRTPDLINNNLNKNYGAADMPNRFTAILVYQTQFGAKGRYALSAPFARALLGDWTVSTVVQAQSGEPFYLTMEGDGAITSRVNRNSGQPLQVPKSLLHSMRHHELSYCPGGNCHSACPFIPQIQPLRFQG